MIISNKSNFIKSDNDVLEILTDKFKLFKKHNFNVVRSIEKKFNKEFNETLFPSSGYIKDFFVYEDAEKKSAKQKTLDRISGKKNKRKVKQNILYVNVETGESFTEYDLKEGNRSIKAHKDDKGDFFYVDEYTGEIFKTIKDNKVNSKYLSDFYTPTKIARIQKCNNWGEFVKFTDGDYEIKQTRSNACGNHLLCPFCASRKASKTQKRTEDFFTCFDEDLNFLDRDIAYDKDMETIIYNEFDKKVSAHTLEVAKDIKSKFGNIVTGYNWYFSVLTVKNGFDIEERMNHLKRGFQHIREKVKLYNRYKKSLEAFQSGIIKKPRKKPDTVFNIIGAIYSIEITYNKKYGWHPHINILMCLDKKIDDCKIYPYDKKKNDYMNKKHNTKNVSYIYWNSKKLSEEWQTITNDSFITSCTPLDMKRDLKKNLMEIIKYSLKFNDLPTDKLVEIYPYLYKQRFFGTLGFMYGLGLDKIKIEKFDKLDRNYIEFVMNYQKGIYVYSELGEIDNEAVKKDYTKFNNYRVIPIEDKMNISQMYIKFNRVDYLPYYNSKALKTFLHNTTILTTEQKNNEIDKNLPDPSDFY